MSPVGEIPAIDVEAAAAMGASAVLLDVREPDEWAAGHAPDAMHLPLGRLADRVAEVPRGRRVVCICRSGNRSGRATAWLRGQGIDAVNMAGGMQAWADSGQPLIDDQGRPGAVR